MGLMIATETPRASAGSPRQVAAAFGREANAGVIQLARCGLHPVTSATEEQEEKNQHEDQADAATAVVTDAGPHVVAAAAEEKNEHNQNNQHRPPMQALRFSFALGCEKF